MKAEDYFKASGLKLHPRTIDDEGNIIEASFDQVSDDWASGKWILAKDDTKAGQLSTVFIGQLFAGPAYFETMLFSDDGDRVKETYYTYAEAIAGHARLKEELEHG